MGINNPKYGHICSAMNWDKEASNELKSEITRRGLTYAQVVTRLSDVGITMTPHAFTKKVNRGGFSHAFFLQCIQVLNNRSNQFGKSDTDMKGA